MISGLPVRTHNSTFWAQSWLLSMGGDCGQQGGEPGAYHHHIVAGKSNSQFVVTAFGANELELAGAPVEQVAQALSVSKD